jgi:hypothetical protein
MTIVVLSDVAKRLGLILKTALALIYWREISAAQRISRSPESHALGTCSWWVNPRAICAFAMQGARHQNHRSRA